MEILLYTNKQIFGGFLIIFLICILFIVNLRVSYGNSFKFGNINISYFITPLIFTLCIIAIMYILSLNKSINNTLDKYILPDEFNMPSCPDGYDTIVEGNNVRCQCACPDYYVVQEDDDNNCECVCAPGFVQQEVNGENGENGENNTNHMACVCPDGNEIIESNGDFSCVPEQE